MVKDKIRPLKDFDKDKLFPIRVRSLDDLDASKLPRYGPEVSFGAVGASAAKSVVRAGVHVGAGFVETPAALAGVAAGASGEMAKVGPRSIFAARAATPQSLQIQSDPMLRIQLGLSDKPGPKNADSQMLRNLRESEAGSEEIAGGIANTIGAPFEYVAGKIRSLNETDVLKRTWKIPEDASLGDKMKDPRWWAEDFAEGASSMIAFLLPGWAVKQAGVRMMQMTRARATALGATVSGSLAAASETGNARNELKKKLMEKGMSEDEAVIIADRGAAAYGIVSGLVERGVFPYTIAGAGATRSGFGGWVLRVLAGGAGEATEEELQMLAMGATLHLSGLDHNITWESAAETGLIAGIAGGTLRGFSTSEAGPNALNEFIDKPTRANAKKIGIKDKLDQEQRQKLADQLKRRRDAEANAAAAEQEAVKAAVDAAFADKAEDKTADDEHPAGTETRPKSESAARPNETESESRPEGTATPASESTAPPPDTDASSTGRPPSTQSSSASEQDSTESRESVLQRIDDALSRMRTRAAADPELSQEPIDRLQAKRDAIAAGDDFDVRDVTEESIRAMGAEIGKLTKATGLKSQPTKTRQESHEQTTDEAAAEETVPAAEDAAAEVSEAVSQAPAEQQAKQPWEMTREEWLSEKERIRRPWAGGAMRPTNQELGDRGRGIDDKVSRIEFLNYGASKVDVELGGSRTDHRDVIEKALSEGKPVPPEVLSDYPDLATEQPDAVQETKEAEATEAQEAAPVPATEVQGDQSDRLDAADRLNDPGVQVTSGEIDINDLVKPPTVPQNKPKTLVDAFEEALADGKSFDNIVQARKFAAEHQGIDKVEIEQHKEIDEAIELALVHLARKIVQGTDSLAQKRAELRQLWEQQPNLSSRTSTSSLQQAYSTPLPMAYAASIAAGISGDTLVYEPTAGNGSLLLEASTDNAMVNELNPDRARNLRSLGFAATEQDATQFDPVSSPDVVIANPPFGKVKGDKGRNKSFDAGLFSTSEVDHAISIKALSAMKDDGRAVLLIGSKRQPTQEESVNAYGGTSRASNDFFYFLYEQYNVVEHVTLDGKLYTKQGASFPVDMIVIEGRKKSSRELPRYELPRLIESFDEMEALADELAAKRGADGVVAGGRSGLDDRGATDSPQDLVPPVSGIAGATSDLDGRPNGISESDRDEQSPTGPVDVERVGIANSDRGDAGSGDTRPERDSAGSVSQESESDLVPESASSSTIDLPPAESGNVVDIDRAGESQEVKPPPQETEYQVTYEPGASSLNSIGSLVPPRMQKQIRQALANVANVVGTTLEEFVAEELGMSAVELKQHFSAEQVDALALAIWNVKKGAGFIIGDQTGVGKGRFVAAMAVWAERNGIVPVFVTAQKSLYNDFMRDVTDIGFNPEHNRYELFVTDQDLDMPIIDGRRIKTPKDMKRRYTEVTESVLSGGKPTAAGKQYNAIALTYHQMTTPNGVARRRMLEAIAPHAMFIFDESHKAGGSESTQSADPISDFARMLVKNGKAAIFSSATYAKRSHTMSLYLNTDMSLAVDDIDSLQKIMQRGGVPMQEIVAEMLADSGQYIRREQSYAGVKTSIKEIELAGEDYENAETMAELFRLVNEFDKIKQSVTKSVKTQKPGSKAGQVSIQQWLSQFVGGIVNHDPSSGKLDMQSTTFASRVTNVVDQMLLAMKAKVAIESIEERVRPTVDGESQKVVIALNHTMETMLDDAMEMHGSGFGDDANVTFSDVMRRYLHRSREITVTLPGASKKRKKGDVIRAYIPDELLGPVGLKAFNDAMARIDESDLSSLPASPIDFIADSLKAKGISVSEITGRSTRIDYSGDVPKYAKRDMHEKTAEGKVKTIKRFQDETDVIIINRAAAEGISLHADKVRAKDLRQRHMFVVQADPNIDNFMQILGRIHRVGQSRLPEYTIISTNLPSERRPLAVLAKKMASLNANVTAGSKGSIGVDAKDIFNVVGDQVVWDIMQADEELQDLLDLSIKKLATKDDGGGGMSRAMTGMLVMLPVEDQRQVWELIDANFDAVLADYQARGENPLFVEDLNLDARQIGRATIKGKRGDSPFQSAAYLDKVSIKSPRKPMTMEQIIEVVQKQPDPQDVIATVDKEFREYIADKDPSKSSTQAAASGFRQVVRVLKMVRPGDAIQMTEPIGQGDNANRLITKGIVLSVKRVSKTKNPAAASAFAIEIAIPSPWLSRRRVTVSVIERKPIAIERIDSWWDADKAFADAAKDVREERFIATGNLVAASEQTEFAGSVIRYTDSDGGSNRGILMPRDYSVSAFLENRPIVFSTVDNAIRFLDAGNVLISANGALQITRVGSTYKLRAERAGDGSTFWRDPSVIEILGEWRSAGASMEVRDVSPEQIKNAITQWMDRMVRFRPSDSARDAAARIEGISTDGDLNTELGGDRGNLRPSGPHQRRGLVLMPFAPKNKDDAIPSSYRHQNPETEDRWARRRVTDQDTFWQKIKDLIAKITHGLTRSFEHIPLGESFAKYREGFRLYREIPSRVQRQVSEELHRIMDGLSKRQLFLFERYLFVQDQIKGAYRGEIIADESIESLEEYRDRLAKEIEAEPKVQAALAQRLEMMNRIVPLLVEHKLLPEDALDNVEYYFHRQINMKGIDGISDAGVDTLGIGGAQATQKRFQKKRTKGGSQQDPRLDPNTSYLISETAWLSQALTELEKSIWVDEYLRRFDRTQEFKQIANATNFENLVGGPKVVDRIMELRKIIAEGDGTPELHAELTQLDPTRPMRKRMAMSIDNIHRLWRRGEIPDMPPSIRRAFDDGRITDIDNPPDAWWKIVGWLANVQGDAPAGIWARTYFKAIQDRKFLMMEQLGDRFMTAEKVRRTQFGDKIGKWQPKAGNVFFKAFTLSDRVLAEFQQMVEKQVGLDVDDVITPEMAITPDDLKEILAMGPARPHLMLPHEVVLQLESMKRRDDAGLVRRGARMLMRLWKTRLLLWPDRIVGYFLRNFTGDFDAMIAGQPGAAKFMARATKELYDFYSDPTGKSSTELVRLAHRLGVIGSSITAIEFHKLQDDKLWKKFYEEQTRLQKANPLGMTARAFKAYYKIASNSNEFRENIARYAAFLYYQRAINAGKLRGFGATRPSTVKSLKEAFGPDVTAARLARDLLGDYGNLTQFGEWLRTSMSPFWAFQEINLKRYPLLIYNAWKMGGAKQGVKTAAVISAVRGLVLTSRIAWMYGVMAFINRWAFPDEEEELGDNDRANPHLNLGRRKVDGSPVVFRNVGALGDFLEWFGLNSIVSQMPEVGDSNLTAEEVLSSIWKDPLNKMVSSIRPDIKGGVETAAGLSFFPDVLNPRAQRRDEAFANIFAATEEYRIIRGKLLADGTRPRPHYLMRKTGLGVIDSQAQSLYSMHALRERWLKAEGRPLPSGIFATSPAKPMRLAAMNEDQEAFEEARRIYMSKGFDYNNFKSVMTHVDPIGPKLNDEDERRFEESLTAGDRRKLRVARDYAAEIQTRMWLMWQEAAKHDKDPAVIAEFSVQLRNEIGSHAHRVASGIPTNIQSRRDWLERRNDSLQWINDREISLTQLRAAYAVYLRDRIKDPQERSKRLARLLRAAATYQKPPVREAG